MFTQSVAPELNMAFGQNGGFAAICPGALPQATVTDGLRPNERAQNSTIRIWPNIACREDSVLLSRRAGRAYQGRTAGGRGFRTD